MCIELRTNSIQSLKLRLKVFLAQSRSRQKNGQRLQCAAQVIDFVNILGAECARPETAPGIRTCQSFLNEPLQCLAHRCAAHSQLFRQSDIRKPLLLTPADHDNALPDLFVSVIHNCGHDGALLSQSKLNNSAMRLSSNTSATVPFLRSF